MFILLRMGNLQIKELFPLIEAGYAFDPKATNPPHWLSDGLAWAEISAGPARGTFLIYIGQDRLSYTVVTNITHNKHLSGLTQQRSTCRSCQFFAESGQLSRVAATLCGLGISGQSHHHGTPLPQQVLPRGLGKKARGTEDQLLNSATQK